MRGGNLRANGVLAWDNKKPATLQSVRVSICFGGGKGSWVQIHSPTSWGDYSVFVPAFGDCPFRIVK
jgi:hypothetical protein